MPLFYASHLIPAIFWMHSCIFSIAIRGLQTMLYCALKGVRMEEHTGHRQRLRERFARAGLAGFAPHEVLELLLTYAIPRRDTKPLARALLQRFGSLPGVLHASAQELSGVQGIGQNAATLITLMLPLFQQYQLSQQQESPLLTTAEARLRYCTALMVGERYERLYALALDAKGRLLHRALISTGDEGETAVYPRLIVAALLSAGASGAVLCHNHPDGEARPSAADVQMTKALAALLRPLSIRLVDHMITAGSAAFSFQQNGLLPTE